MEEQQSPNDKSLSILDRFRQLSKQKEKSTDDVPKPKSNETVGAVYLNKNKTQNHDRQFDSGDQNPGRKFNRNGTEGRDHRGRRGFSGGRKRKFSREQKDSGDCPSHLNLKQGEQQKQVKDKVGMHIGVSEPEVGITEFVSDHEGFTGIIKQRYGDFNVNEITKDGTIVKLTSMEANETPSNEEPIVLNNDDDLFKILPKEQCDKLYSIVQDDNTESCVEIEVTDMTKEDRIKIHALIKNLFKTSVNSNTIDENGKKILKISYNQSGKVNERKSWKNGEFLHFVVYKENTDTTEAVNSIANKLRIKPNMIQSCGTKDKRGRTTQMMCIKKMSVNKCQAIQPLKSIKLGNYAYKMKTLRLGQLKGNRFRIAVRNITCSDSVVSNAVMNFKENGFINYFGLQRFGQSYLVPTFAIGLMMIKKNWKQAVELILKPRPNERSYADMIQCRNIWWETRDAAKALKALDWRNSTLEKRVLDGLKEFGGNNYKSALEYLPKNMLTFYCHSYQSFIWNKIISRRIKEFGFKPLAGDIVLVTEVNANEEEEQENKSRKEEVEKNQLPEIGLNPKQINVKFLTEDEAKEASLYDIVYPLPGHDIEFPKNVIADWYTELLAKDGLTIEILRQTATDKGLFSLYGSFRKIMTRAEDLNWSIVHYSDPDTDLILSDVDEMNGVKPLQFPPVGEYKALRIEFSLDACSYATMALRELMKCQTSTSFHANLTAMDKAQSSFSSTCSSDCQNDEEESKDLDKEVKEDGMNQDEEKDEETEEVPPKKLKLETNEGDELKEKDDDTSVVETETMETEIADNV